MVMGLSRDKSGVSNVVGYALLIVITIALMVLVYLWLRGYVGGDDVEQCPPGVDVIVKSYDFHPATSVDNGSLKVVLKNKGRFTVDGYTLRVHDEEGAAFGFYVLDENGTAIAPGKEHEQTYNFSDYDFDGHVLIDVTLIDVQPFLLDGDVLKCRSRVARLIDGYCGDGVIDSELGEECDDGNYVSGDGCDVGCIISFVPLYSFEEGCFDEYTYGMTLFNHASCFGVDLCFCSVLWYDGIIVLDTPDLPVSGDYNVIFLVGLDGNSNESYQVLCGSKVYDFSDSVYNDNVVSEYYENVLCDFDAGVNELSFNSIADGSVHFHSIEITSTF